MIGRGRPLLPEILGQRRDNWGQHVSILRRIHTATRLH